MRADKKSKQTEQKRRDLRPSAEINATEKPKTNQTSGERGLEKITHHGTVDDQGHNMTL